MRIPTVFFCYAWEDDSRFRKLDAIREKILRKSNNMIDVILDRRNYEDNDSFEELRNRIHTYDLVVVFCTPDLKRIIDKPNSEGLDKEREVLKEFEIIRSRFEKNQSSVFPVILEGTKKSSLPKLFESVNASEIDKLGLYKNKRGRYTFPKAQESLVSYFVGRVISYATYNCKHKSQEYASTREALDKLFNLKDNTDLPDSCLVQSDLYPRILSQTYYFVAGRKGSGKSTFINNFGKMDEEQFNEKYKQMNPISAESFGFAETYYSLIHAHQSDLNNISMYNILCVYWQVIFFLHVVLTICYEIDDCVLTNRDSRYRTFNSYCKKFKKLLGLKQGNRYKSIRGDLVPELVFHAARELVSDQFHICLVDIKEGELMETSFFSRFNMQAIIDNAFGKKDTQEFLEALSKCKKKIMISLDGFNTRSDDFRRETETKYKDTEEYYTRNEFETLFYRTLIEVVTKYKNFAYADPASQRISKYVDFCIVFPKDRYDQIIGNDRDSFKKSFASLSWTAYELLELVTRRLEYLMTTITGKPIEDNSNNWYNRMDNALNFFTGLPKTISMKVQDNVISMTLFNYILRSSFWRPRDVISNVSALLSLVVRADSVDDRDIFSLEDTNSKLTEDEVKLAIKDNSQRIIKEEFVEENREVFRNLQEVLDNFNYRNEQMTIREFKMAIRGVEFDASYSYDLREFRNKVSVLYQLGVIGLRFDKKYSQEMHYLHNICFVFNAGMVPFEEFIKSKDIEDMDVQIVINPIFARALRLSFENTSELLGNWQKDYVIENYKMKKQIRYL